MAGYLGASDMPLTHHGDELQFEPRTSDPATTDEGEAWLRSDLAPETNQLATLRFDAGNEIWDIPVYEPGTSPAEIEEVLRISIGGTVGFIPVTDTSPAYRELGFQHAGTRLGLHDALEVSAIPDSAVHRWRMAEGSGTTVADAIGNADMTLNGAGWDSVTSSWIDGWATVYNGSGDESVVSANRSDPGDSGSFVITLRARSISGNNFAFSHPDTDNNNRLYVFVPESGTLSVNVGDQTVALTSSPATDTNYRVGVKWDSGSITGYLNGAEVGTGTYTGSVTVTTQDWFFGAQKSDTLLFDGYLDDPIMATEPWTDQQFQEDYNRQPWV